MGYDFNDMALEHPDRVRQIRQIIMDALYAIADTGPDAGRNHYLAGDPGWSPPMMGTTAMERRGYTGISDTGDWIINGIAYPFTDIPESEFSDTPAQAPQQQPPPEEWYADNLRDAAAKADAQREPRIITPAAFVWCDPKTIPPRAFLMGTHYIRKYVSATIAPGGLGKSALVTVEALEGVTGKRLIGHAPRKPLKVWYLGEDDERELKRRFLAAMKFYAIKPEDIGDRLFVSSFRDTKIIVAQQAGGTTVINLPDVEALINACQRLGIDVLMIDPLVKTHRVPENDNGAMELAYTTWVDIAERANCAVELVVHSRKASAGQARSIEDVRGASSQLGAVRDARLIVRMTDEEAPTMGVKPGQASRHIRIGDAKVNMVPAPDGAEWLRLESVSLDNATDDEDADNLAADSVQVVTKFQAPGLFDGIPWQDIDAVMRALKATPRRENEQAADWAGHLVGELLAIDSTDAKSGKPKVKTMLKTWLASGALKSVRMPDSHGDDRPFVTLGRWVFRTPNEAGNT